MNNPTPTTCSSPRLSAPSVYTLAAPKSAEPGEAILLVALIFLLLVTGGCHTGPVQRIQLPAGSSLADLQPMSQSEAFKHLKAVAGTGRTLFFGPATNYQELLVKVQTAGGLWIEVGRPSVSLETDFIVDEMGISDRTQNWEGPVIGELRSRLAVPKVTVQPDIVFNDVIRIKISNRSLGDPWWAKIRAFYVLVESHREKQDYWHYWQSPPTSLPEAYKTVSAFATLCPQIQEYINNSK
jgi:hypothetical protein